MSPQPTIVPRIPSPPRPVEDSYAISLSETNTSISDGELQDMLDAISDGEVMDETKLIEKYLNKLRKPQSPPPPPPPVSHTTPAFENSPTARRRMDESSEFGSDWEKDVSEGELGDAEVSDGMFVCNK